MTIPRSHIEEVIDSLGWGVGDFKPTSPRGPEYNCIAWSLGRNDIWFWPEPDTYKTERKATDNAAQEYWPGGILDAETPEAFVQFYGLPEHGYKRLPKPDVRKKKGVEKVAVFTEWRTNEDAKGPDAPQLVEYVTHAALQLESGLWATKIGRIADVEIEDLGLLLPEYGTGFFILARPRRPASWKSPLFPAPAKR